MGRCEAATAEEPGAPLSGRRVLMVIVEGVVSTHDLPDDAPIILGRGHDCDVVIDHPSISRRHAALRPGTPATLEDLGSANGTRVRGATLAAGSVTPLDAGEIADVGAAMIVVQRRAQPLRSRRVWTHGFFQARVEEACLRGGRFSVIRVHASAPARTVEPLLHDAVGPGGVLGYYAPGEYEVMTVDAGVPERIRGALAAAGIDDARTGVAQHPADGRGAEALLMAASRGARPSLWRDQPVLAPGLGRLLERVAPSPINVLILGETGAGKEIVAEAVHRMSPRSAGPFVRLSCAALSESLLESELFGHEKGAFTGAALTKPGLLETAGGGTLFLDEIGELPLSMQSKLLRVLEERKVRRVGGVLERPIDIRLVSATNRDLEAEAQAGRFRLDLYYRLNGISLLVPPLRERVPEIARLARGFVAQACEHWGRTFEPALSGEALALLEAHDWPGNVRELRNVVERAVLLCGDGPIEPGHLPMEKPVPRGQATDFQRVLDALRRSAGNQTAAADLLGISRRTLIHRLDEYGLPRPVKGRRSEP